MRTMGGLAVPELVMLFLVGVAAIFVVALPASMICRRIGLPPWLGVIVLIPGANLMLLWYVALAQWPAVPWTAASGQRVSRRDGA